MHHIVIESTATLDGQHIRGTALFPTISGNGNLYTPAVIDSAENIGVPLRLDWEHDITEKIGYIVYEHGPNHTLVFDGYITDQTRASQAKNGTYKVSIEASIDEVSRACDKKACYNMPLGLKMEGMGITDTPGVPQTTLIIEKFIDWEPITNGHCSKCNSSLSETLEKPKVMTDETSKTTPTEKVEIKETETTPTETKTETVKTETKPETPKVEAPTAERQPDSSWIASIDDINARLKEFKEMVSDVKARINNPAQFKELDAMIEAAKNPYRVARVTPTGNSFAQEDIKRLSEEMLGSLKKFGRYSWEIDLSPEFGKKAADISEAITFSTSQSSVVPSSSDVFLLPGGKHIKSIRNLVAFDEIPAGADTINKFKGNIPNNQSITEQSAITYNGHTVTTIQLTADTVTGNGEAIKMADIEDSPFQLMSYLNQAARAEVLEAEATLAYTTAAAAATPNLWINANSGATITHTDIASMTMEPVAMRVALQDLETSGYDTSFGNAYCALHPKALRELRGSTNLTTYVQQGDAVLTKTGQLSHLYGIELYPTTALDTDDNTTNDVYNNVVGIKGHTFWLAAKRELTLTLLQKANPLGVDFTWSQRKNATCFDPASFIRVSSAQ